ncbi:NAD-dependent epimerase/dehydratase family protein [Microbacterium sp. BWT-B31]|uniref:NAD-dependent epimerase/dehydratase family protein n=1 Tax=Microbacterium sp. BWT-B31 TaxID=3232072 RepID=UPI003526FBD3
MTDVLILGGTGWLSGRVARRWTEAGASVTCLARGGRPAPEGVRLLRADRDDPGAYDEAAARDWDEVVDVSSRAGHVAAAVEALAERTAHWTYVSTVSVYADDTTAGADESAATAEPAAPGDEYDYAREKSAAEASVRTALAQRAAIVRPGLIVGEGDPTDRFGYWVGRFALAGDGPVLVPDVPGLGVQVIDVDNVAAFVHEVGRTGSAVVANAVGDTLSFAGFTALAREVAGHTGDLVAADPDLLAESAVAHWMGPRSLPLWLPDDLPGSATRSNAAYRAGGGRLRALRDTLERTLADERARGLDRERRAGLSHAEELDLIERVLIG